MCENDLCKRYSDVDVYHSDGTTSSMCYEHAWQEADVTQIVPQHFAEVNQTP